MSLLAVLVLPVLLVLLGSRFSGLLARPGDGALYRCVVYGLAGAVVFHLLLTLLDLAGIPWHPILLLAGLGILIAAGHVYGRKADGTRLPSDLGWGDGVALFVLTVFAVLALTQWIMTPDFVFHWGLKGERFFLARGIDEAWLARNDMIHSDYPNLLPELYAASALFGGRFDPPVLMLWSALFFAGLLAAAREALRVMEDRFIRQAGLALVALAVGLFGIGWLTAGGADWMIALALLAALPPLLRPPDEAGDWQIGIAAAFAAASKIEGVPLAGFLILVQLVRRLQIRTLARLALPAAAVVIPWVARVIQYNLFQKDNAGPFEIGRAGALFSTAYEILAGPYWHGVAWVVLLTPLLLLPCRTRAFAAVVTLQLLFYLYVYFTAPVDVRYYVLTSLPRLLLHVIPGVLVLVALLASLQPRKTDGSPRGTDGWPRGSDGSPRGVDGSFHRSDGLTRGLDGSPRGSDG